MALVGIVDVFVIGFVGAALYRSFGKTSTTMYISVIANILNVVGKLYRSIRASCRSNWSGSSVTGIQNIFCGSDHDIMFL